MSAKLQAADAIRRLAVQLQGMNEAADILEALGSTEQVIAQAKIDSEKARKDLFTSTGLLDEANKNLAAARAEAGNVLNAAQEKADALITQARLDADALVTEAKKSADSTVRDAVAAATDKATRETADAHAQLASLMGQVQVATAQLEQLQAKTDTEHQASAEAQAKATGKPEKVVQMIVEGKVKTWTSENVLVEQKFVKDDSKTITDVLAPTKLEVVSFKRFKVGELSQ